MSSGISFTCDSCGREIFGCTFVNGMKFCAKCYQETFGETDKDRKIANLEAKLAEKDKEIERLNLEFETQEDWQEKWQKLYDETCNLTQDKISFAVEQLEKVKEFFLEEHRDEEMDTDYIITKDAGEIADYLLAQIKQLKEMK